MEKKINELIIYPPYTIAIILSIFYGIILIVGLFTLIDFKTFSIFGFTILIGAIGLFFNIKKSTKKIIFNFESKNIIIKDFFSKKIIKGEDIETFKRVHSPSKGDWFGIVLKNDKYGIPIQISFPPIISSNIHNHANIFEKEELPKIMSILK